jgi:hypothetical protein
MDKKLSRFKTILLYVLVAISIDFVALGVYLYPEKIDSELLIIAIGFSTLILNNNYNYIILLGWLPMFLFIQPNTVLVFASYIIVTIILRVFSFKVYNREIEPISSRTVWRFAAGKTKFSYFDILHLLSLFITIWIYYRLHP